MAKRIALIDGDIITYRAGFAAEHKEYYLRYKKSDSPEIHELVFEGKKMLNEFLKENADDIVEHEWESKLNVEPLKFVLATVKHMIDRIVSDTGADDYEFYLSDKDNFRNSVATIAHYKGNREQKRKSMHHESIIDYVKKFHHAVTVPYLEADDVLAERQRYYTANGDDSVIASDDKDLLQVPGKHYNVRTQKKKLVSPETGHKRLYIQALTGDRSDNIPGIYRVGDKTAEEILKDVDPEDYRDTVKEQWSKYLQHEKNAPDWLRAFDPHTESIVYRDKNGDICDTSLDALVNEIIRLVEIGLPVAFGVEQDDR